ncbi:hypothetical protein T4B_5610 [Trichinella pseudospiralis]|uniref:Uncharacterized protein n=1 Tax=Trichinella pseudospiralis TaxID=6337 RepID=A0A0V1IC44_TRIPS|nr:hypothetical protein T4B_5610 [Trichinella pseudospiralis]
MLFSFNMLKGFLLDYMSMQIVLIRPTDTFPVSIIYIIAAKSVSCNSLRFKSVVCPRLFVQYLTAEVKCSRTPEAHFVKPISVLTVQRSRLECTTSRVSPWSLCTAPACNKSKSALSLGTRSVKSTERIQVSLLKRSTNLNQGHQPNGLFLADADEAKPILIANSVSSF